MDLRLAHVAVANLNSIHVHDLGLKDWAAAVWRSFDVRVGIAGWQPEYKSDCDCSSRLWEHLGLDNRSFYDDFIVGPSNNKRPTFVGIASMPKMEPLWQGNTRVSIHCGSLQGPP